MTFLNPLYLIGVLAGLIPLLIHLFHKRRIKVVEFSSLEFLKKIEGRKTKWFRIRQILLLVLRCLALLLLALAISRPVLRSAVFGTLSAHARSSSVFVLDNSYSMGATGRDRSSFDRARSRADEILSIMDKGDEIYLILASDMPRSVFEEPVHNHPLVRTAISEATLTNRPTDYRPSLEKAINILGSSRNLNKEIYLFTDLQRSGFESFARGGIRAGKGKRLYVFDTAPLEDINNASLADLALADPLLFEGGKVILIATIRNYTARESRVSLRSSLDGREVGVKEVNLPANATRTVELAFSVEGEGFHYISTVLDDDGLQADNARYVSFNVPGKPRVALIAEDKSQAEGYLNIALTPEEGLSVFRVDAFARGEFPSIPLSNYSVIGLLDVTSLNSADVLRLANFVQTGGGVFVALGDAADIDFYNTVLLPKLGDMQVGRARTRRRENDFFLRISSGDFSHPVLLQFRDKSKGDLTIARIYDRVVIDAGSGTIARFSDTSPFLVETSLGEGKVIISAVPLNGSLTDLPLRAIYVPLVHRIFRYLSMGEEVISNASVGDRLSFPTTGIGEIVCTPPDGKGVRIEPRIRSGRVHAEYDMTETPGIYAMYRGDSLLAYFSVNSLVEESDLTKGAEEETRLLLAELRPTFLSPRESPDARIFNVRLGVELTNPLLLLVILILTVEMIVAGRYRGVEETKV